MLCIHRCSCLCLQEYKEYHTDTDVHFQLMFSGARIAEVMQAGAHAKLKLMTKTSIGEQQDAHVLHSPP